MQQLCEETAIGHHEKEIEMQGTRNRESLLDDKKIWWPIHP
jgi:hypothetical protein